MKALWWAAAAVIAIVVYFAYGYTHSSWYAEHTDPQKAMYAAERDVQDEANRRVRDAGIQAAQLIREGKFDEARRVMERAKMEQKEIDRILGHTETPPPVPVPVAQAAPPPVAQAEDPVARGRKSFYFQLLDPAVHSYQLDARDLWQELDVVAEQGSWLRLTMDPDAQLCSSNFCIGPVGTGLVAKDTNIGKMVPCPDCTAYGAIAKWGQDGQIFQIGPRYKTRPIPPESYGKSLYVAANAPTQIDLRGKRTGGFLITSLEVYKP